MSPQTDSLTLVISNEKLDEYLKLSPTLYILYMNYTVLYNLECVHIQISTGTALRAYNRIGKTRQDS